ncbi:MAG: ATP-binding cassette domain-containing protein, partial [Betaproteobacteria bacterium]
MGVLTTTGLTIRFGGHVAVNGVSCSFEPGTLTAIVGPNGAGKTTYFNLISGQLKATSGSVSLNGRDLSGLSASARTRAGLGRAFQLTNLFPNLSVLENVRVAVQATREGAHRRGLNLWSIWSDHRALTERAHEILHSVSLDAKAASDVASLSHGDQRKLEVAMLMALDSQVFMFDEPTAGMSADEMPAVLNLIRQLRQDKT